MVTATIADDSAQNHALVSRVFSCFLGDAQSTPRSAARVACAVEEQFIIDGWPLGRNYGSEFKCVVQVQAAMAVNDPTAALAQGPKFIAIDREYSQWLKSH